MSHLFIILPTIPPAQFKNWLAWREGVDDWMPLESFPELEQTMKTLQYMNEQTDPPPKSRLQQPRIKTNKSEPSFELQAADISAGADLELDFGFNPNDHDRRPFLESHVQPGSKI